MHSKFPDPNLTFQIDLKISPQYCKKLYACSCLGGKECEGLFRLCVNNIIIT